MSSLLTLAKDLEQQSKATPSAPTSRV
nr:MbeB family mobilization protein [Klebsiella pneumoniae]